MQRLARFFNTHTYRQTPCYFYLRTLFYIKDVNDANVLMKELRETKGLRRINVIHCAPIPKHEFIPPLSKRDLQVE